MIGSEIIAALSDNGPIPKERVLSSIDAAADSDPSTLSKLYRLTGEAYYRIDPELGGISSRRYRAVPTRLHSRWRS